MLCGLKFISVDPMVTDDYHQKIYNDSHFAKRTFPVTKQDKIKNLLNEVIGEFTEQPIHDAVWRRSHPSNLDADASVSNVTPLLRKPPKNTP